jgi:hypothetical protein
VFTSAACIRGGGGCLIDAVVISKTVSKEQKQQENWRNKTGTAQAVLHPSGNKRV